MKTFDEYEELMNENEKASEISTDEEETVLEQKRASLSAYFWSNARGD